MTDSLSRRLGAEFTGTAFLLATVIGSGIMAERLAGGNVAIALLCNTIPTGAILVILITMFGPISGAHFNPAVSLVFRLKGQLDNRLFVLYTMIQVTGGVVGVWAAHLMFEETVLQLALKERTGLSQWFAEAVATFGLVMTIVIIVRVRSEAVALGVGLYITAAYWFTASTSFANPAVTVARGLSDTFAGIRPEDIVPFVLAQVVGAVAAHLYCLWQLGGSRKDEDS